MGATDFINGSVDGAANGSSPFASSQTSIQAARANAIPSDARTTPDPFWDTSVPDETLWDKQFPYQLIMLRHVGNGKYARVPKGVFTLPIPPQALQKSMPFAIVNSITQGGVVEQHNGTPVRMITLQGTTGVLPGRPTGKILGGNGIVQSVFAGTIRAVDQFTSAVGAIQNTFAGFSRPNIVTDSDLEGDLQGTTGYYQFLLLEQFLISYATLKTTDAGKDIRLAFAHWKTQQVYLVTPTDFSAQQNVQSPLETTFNLSMKAWRQIKLDSPEALQPVNKPVIRDAGAMQTLLTGIDECRGALAAAKNVVSSFGQDASTGLFEPLRETALFVKDLLGVPITLADVPVEIARGAKAAILEWINTSKAASSLGADLKAETDQIGDFSVITGKAETGASIGPGYQPAGTKQQAIGASNPHPGNKLLENPEDNYALFAQIKPAVLNLSPSTSKAILQERERVRQFGRLDFEKRRDTIAGFQSDFTDSIGAGHPTYSRVYGLRAPTVFKNPTQDQFDAIFQMNAAILAMNKLAASGTIDDQNKLTVLEYVAGLAGRSGITFKVPASQLQVPWPYGSTLEQVAARYLGDPDRWHEIAALNRLREPYVDEEGFDLTLLVNGNGHEIVLADVTNLFIGQSVWLSSNVQPRSKRRITGITTYAGGTNVVTLDGDPNLDIFTTIAAASLHAYLPDTVNSQMLISIPSNQAPDTEDFQAKSIPGLNEFDNLLQVGGVDLLLTTDGDAAITSDGDWRLAVGMQNLVQEVRTFASTPRGSLVRHTKYGLLIEPGTSTADVNAKQLLSSVQDLLTFEPAFTGVRSAAVLKSGPVTSMTVSLDVAGQTMALPVTVDIKR